MAGMILMALAIFGLINWMGNAAGWLHSKTPTGRREERESEKHHQKRMKMIAEINALKKQKAKLIKEYDEYKRTPMILYVKGERREFTVESAEGFDIPIKRCNDRINELNAILHPVDDEYYPNLGGQPEREIPGMYWNQ